MLNVNKFIKKTTKQLRLLDEKVKCDNVKLDGMSSQ